MNDSEKLTLRMANAKDVKLIFDWANCHDVRMNSLNSDKILYKNHVEWYNNKLNDANCRIYIMENQDTHIGQIRVDMNNGVGTISYMIDEKFRGMGYCLKIVSQIEEIEDVSKSVNTLFAIVKNENTASQKIFEDLMYIKRQEANYITYTKRI